MIKIFYTATVILLSSNFVGAQILLNNSFQQIEDDLIFNRSFLLHNDIKTISAEYMVKKDWQGLSKYGEKIEYKFDESGNMVYKNEMNLIANNWETSEVFYSYNLQNKLVEEKTKRKDGFWIKEYKYNNDKIVEVINYMLGDEPESSKQIELNSQSFTWKTLNDSTVQKSIANNYGQPYLIITYHYDKEMDYLKSEEQSLVVVGTKEKIYYTYNKFGWLKSVSKGEKQSEFLYDDFGNVIEVNNSESGKQKKHVEYLYKSNGLLEAQLKTEGESSTIHIFKYTIEHFN